VERKQHLMMSLTLMHLWSECEEVK